MSFSKAYTLRCLLLLTLSLTALAQEESTTSVPVTVKPLSEVLIERRLTANAEVMALNNSPLSSELTAVVEKINVDLGDAVKQGDVLIELDPVDYELQLSQTQSNLQAAKARLVQAQLRLDRANELKQNQYISTDDLLARETELAVQKAETQSLQVAVKSAQRQLEKTNIKAPFTGIVTQRSAQVGQLLTPGSLVLNLTQTVDQEIHAQIPSQLAATLNQAIETPNSITFESGQFSVIVELLQLSAVINKQTAVQLARFKVIGQQPLIGQTGQLVWLLSDSLLSADMVVKRQGKLGVFIAENNTAKFQSLSQAQEGRPVVIDKNLNWQIIVGGRDRLQDGDAITVK